MQRPQSTNEWGSLVREKADTATASELALLLTWANEDRAAQISTRLPGVGAAARLDKRAIELFSETEPSSPFEGFPADEPAAGVAEQLQELRRKTQYNPGCALQGIRVLASSADAWLNNRGPCADEDLPEVRSRKEALELLSFTQNKLNDHPVTASDLAFACTNRIGWWVKTHKAELLGTSNQNAELLEQLAQKDRDIAAYLEQLHRANAVAETRDRTAQDALHARLVEEHRRKGAEERAEAGERLAKAAQDQAYRLSLEVSRASEELAELKAHISQPTTGWQTHVEFLDSDFQ